MQSVKRTEKCSSATQAEKILKAKTICQDNYFALNSSITEINGDQKVSMTVVLPVLSLVM